MNYLIEKLIGSEIIKDYSSLVYREDFSEAKYKFEFPITEGMTIDQVRKELIEDIFKLTLSIRKHTGGVKHISDEDMEPTEMDARQLEKFYGGNQYTLYILFPSRMAKHKPKKMLLGFYIPIPGRPRCLNINKYWCKIVSIISTEGSKRTIADPSVKKIMEEAELYGLENIKSFDFYVFEDEPFRDEKEFRIIMVYNFKDDGEKILKDRQQNKILTAEMKRLKREQKEKEEQERKEAEEKYQREKAAYLEAKEKFLDGYDGPASYYREKEWLRTHGDPRFEDPGELRMSNYTGD